MGPTLGFPIHETMEIGLKTPIYNLSLPVGLKMISCNVLEGNSLKFKQFCPKMTHENLVLIGNNGLWKAMKMDNVFSKLPSHSDCYKGLKRKPKRGIRGKNSL